MAQFSQPEASVSTSDPPQDASSAKCIFAHTGEFWTIGYSGQTFLLRDVKGLSYIQMLLQHPGEDFHAIDLVRGAAVDPAIIGEAKTSFVSQSLSVRALSDSGEMLDAQAKRQYKDRLLELREELKEVEERGDYQRAKMLESEIDSLARELARATGLGGRDRRAGSVAERARLSVTRAIRAALEKIRQNHVEFGERLGTRTRTGSFCRYVKDASDLTVWQFSVSAEDSSKKPVTAVPPVIRRENSVLSGLGRLTSYIGRREEDSSLRAVLEDAINGQGHIVMIGGAPGIGKSRTARQFAAEAVQRGAFLFLGNCYEGESVPFLPFVEILERFVAQTNGPEEVRQLLGPDAREIARLVPELRRILPDMPAPMDVEPEQSRRVLFNAVTDLLARTAEKCPLLILIEDLQWADEGALSLLQHVGRAVPALPIMIIGTYRDTELDPAGRLAILLHDLMRLHLLERMTLSGLTRDQVAQMLRALSGREPPEDLVDTIYSWTEGNPFFVEELFHHLVEHGELLDLNGDFRKEVQVALIRVPRSIRLVIDLRLARLSRDTQTLLSIAALVGRSFTFDIVEAVARSDADSILDCLEEAESAGVISSTLEHPETKFQFSHEIIRQEVLTKVSAVRRQRLSVQLADAIEQLYSHDIEGHAPDIARHLWNGGAAAQPNKVLKYSILAAELAARAVAYSEALRHLDKALETLNRLPSGPTRARDELEIRLRISALVIVTKGYAAAEVRAPIGRMLALCDQIDDPLLLFPVELQLWFFLAVRGDGSGHALEISERLMNTARDNKDKPMFSVWAHLATGSTFHHCGDFPAARQHLEQATLAYANCGEVGPESFANPCVLSLAYLSLTLCAMGYVDRAFEMAESAVKLARNKRDHHGLAHALFFSATIRVLRGEAALALVLAEETLDIATKYQLQLLMGHGTIWRGIALSELGRADEGLRQIMQGVSRCVDTGARLGMTYWMAFLAKAYLDASYPDLAVQLLEDIPGVISLIGEKMFESELYRIRGEALARSSASQGEPAVLTAFHMGLECARRQQAKLFELRCAMSLGRFLLDSGRHEEASKLIIENYNWFKEGLETPALRDARLFIDELPSTSPRCTSRCSQRPGK